MPRYDFKCHTCKGETIILSHDDHPIDQNYVNCAYCGKQVMLMGYYEDDDQRVADLQAKIDALKDRMDALEDYEGITTLTLIKDSIN